MPPLPMPKRRTARTLPIRRTAVTHLPASGKKKDVIISEDDDDTDDSDATVSTNDGKGDDDDGGNNDAEDEGKDLHPDDLLLRAMSHKEDGNAHFKSGDYTSATRSYRKGTNLLKKLNKNNTGDEQVKNLLMTLQTNLSMVCYRQKKHRMSRDVAAKALAIDATNVKALYRRAVASRAMGDVDAAKSDLKTALNAEPNNVSVKKEWVSLKKSSEEQKKKEKARLQKAFSNKGGSLLYSDKEEEEKRKTRERAERKRKEKEAEELRKKEWEDECVRRMASDPPEEAISYEDWDKERKKKEEDEKKAREKARKEEQDRKRKERQRKNKENKKDDSDDDDELTEKELAMLRGYKKTSDGRTTSYFNREQTEHEKQLIGCIKPKRLEPQNSSGTNIPPPSPTTSVSSGGGGGAPVGSVWNQSGTTWEEKDTTDWCKKTLERCLLETTTAYYSESSNNDSTYVSVVTKVSDLTGDASVAIAGGKKRYIYDFHASLDYEIHDDAQETVASGTLKLPDVNSATTVDEDELEVEIFGWKKAPASAAAAAAEEEGEHRRAMVVQDVTECRKMLVQDVRKSVLKFVETFNANF
mmetsp:Transcript_34840/g.73500  ORF Transcript_34840/g.73500 Transcript_34840/m.73500 type:complete len:583 (+) Transcript_34840:1271-3019(+)